VVNDNGESPRWVLRVSCVSGDEVQAVIHRREDVGKWLKTLDHEGAYWTLRDVVEDREFGPDDWKEGE